MYEVFYILEDRKIIICRVNLEKTAIQIASDKTTYYRKYYVDIEDQSAIMKE